MADQNPSIDKLREIVEKRRHESETTPGQDVAVDDEGQIVVMEITRYGVETSRPVSRVPKDTFAASSSRLREEQSFVHSNMPSNTYRVNENGIEGWIYEINTGSPHYDDYVMFLYNSSYYYVKLVDPPYAGEYGVHESHLYSDGKICLSSRTDGGYSTMDKAYAKSVLWAKGFSQFRRTSRFPFLSS